MFKYSLKNSILRPYVNSEQSMHLKKHASYIPCFKKKMFNSVLINDGRFVPGFNRRKHAISHALIYNHQQRQFSKMFGFISSKEIQFIIGASLKLAQGDANISAIRSMNHAKPFTKRGSRNLALKMIHMQTCLCKLMNTIETRSNVLMCRNIWAYGSYQSRNAINHGKKRTSTCGTILGHSYAKTATSTYMGFDTENHSWVQPGDTLRYDVVGL